MGGGSSTSAENGKEENKEEKKEDKKKGKKEGSEEREDSEESEESDESESLEKIKEEKDEEDEDDKKKDKNKNKDKDKKDDEKDKKSKKSKKSSSSKLINNNKKNKNDKDYFSIEEPSSKKQSEKSSVDKNKDINNDTNILDKTSFIDARKYNTNSSINSSRKPQSNEISEIYSTNSNYVDPPHRMNHSIKRNADNQVFGEFNYTNDIDKIYEEIEGKNTETEEESMETYKELTFKEKVFNEYHRHKDYLDTNEKGVYAKINKKSYKNAKRYKYRKSLLLHEKEITCICSLSGTINKMAYATSSIDKTIKFWNAKFIIVNQVKKLEWYSTFICEFDTTNILSSESIYIKMYDLMPEKIECIRKFRDHIEDINYILPLIDFQEEKYIFISGGKDKILRLWDHEMEAPIKYYEGHYDTVTYIQKIGNNNKKIISCSIDKTFIIWDIKNSNPIKVFNNYFNQLYLLGDNIGFCCGAYDNKLRFYDSDYLLIKCLVSELYGINFMLMIDDYYMLTVDINNNINVIDLYENNFLFAYTGCTEEVVRVIKSFNWDLDNSENKIIITACKDGYVYLYSFELEINKKESNKEKKSQKKEKSKNGKDKKGKEKEKKKKNKDKKEKSKKKDKKEKEE